MFQHVCVVHFMSYYNMALPWQPHVPLPGGTVRDSSANTWRHSGKCTAQTCGLLCSQTNHFAGEATENSVLFQLCCGHGVPSGESTVPSVGLGTAPCTESHTKLHIPWLQTGMLLTHPPQLSPPAFQTGWSVNSEKQKNCSGTDMKTKGMVSKLDIKKHAKINCGKQVKILRNNILTTTFQENCSKVNTCSDTFFHPSDSQVGSQKM